MTKGTPVRPRARGALVCAVLALGAAAAGGALGGCTPVKPWQKGRLAGYVMHPDLDEGNKIFENKVFSVMESAGGGEADAVGGGCGCN
jgi:Domain of unknown function (DUF4266)